jgi:predicted metal-binding protein
MIIKTGKQEHSASRLFINMINSFSCVTSTPSANFNYNVSIVQIIPDDLIGFVDKIKFDAMCISGCPNYEKKWSCPPFSPAYEHFISGWKYLYLYYIQIKMNQFTYIKSDYLKIKAANNILKSKADNYIRKMASKNGKYISTGSCRLCKPCKCKIGQSCLKYEIMTYSYEAMGIDVNALVEKYFNSKLLWYRRGQLPDYTSIVCGILSNDLNTHDNLRDEYIQLNLNKK